MNIIGQNGNDGIHYEKESIKKEEYVEKGYQEKNNDWQDEQKELETILRKRLSPSEVDALKKSKLKIMNEKNDDNDDLIIKYT